MEIVLSVLIGFTYHRLINVHKLTYFVKDMIKIQENVQVVMKALDLNFKMENVLSDNRLHY